MNSDAKNDTNQPQIVSTEENCKDNNRSKLHQAQQTMKQHTYTTTNRIMKPQIISISTTTATQKLQRSSGNTSRLVCNDWNLTNKQTNKHIYGQA